MSVWSNELTCGHIQSTEFSHVPTSSVPVSDLKACRWPHTFDQQHVWALAKPKFGKRQIFWRLGEEEGPCHLYVWFSPSCLPQPGTQAKLWGILAASFRRAHVHHTLATSFPPTRFFLRVQIKLTSFSKEMNFSKHFKGTCQLKPEVEKGMQSNVLMGGRGGFFTSCFETEIPGSI